jgi:GR25 family glycosyltransferase involved in LPS biosynthesis
MKAFIIHLPNIETSSFFAKRLQIELAKEGIVADLFIGTYSEDAVKLFEKEDRNICEVFYKGKPISGVSRPGVKGCFHSHYRLWQECIKLDEPIMVFEDDVKLYRGYIPVDFQDVLMLSVCTEWKISKPFMHLLENSNSESVALKYKGECMIGTSGYVIKPHAAKKLLEFYKNSYTAADHAMNNNIISLEIHSKLMGRSLTEEEGKKSLTK